MQSQKNLIITLSRFIQLVLERLAWWKFDRNSTLDLEKKNCFTTRGDCRRNRRNENITTKRPERVIDCNARMPCKKPYGINRVRLDDTPFRAKEIDTFRNIKRRRHLCATRITMTLLLARTVSPVALFASSYNYFNWPFDTSCVASAAGPVVRCEPESVRSGLFDPRARLYVTILLL